MGEHGEGSGGVGSRGIDDGGLLPEPDRFRTLIAALPRGIQEIDTRGIITFANPAHRALYGYDEGDLVGKSILELNPPGPGRDDLRAHLAHLVAEQPPPVPWSSRNVTRDGREIHIQVDWDYKRDAAGRVVGFVSVLTDVTAQREAEEALRWESAVNCAVAHLAKALISEDYEASHVAALLLGLALELVRCEQGYVGEVDLRTGNLVAHSVSEAAEPCPSGPLRDFVFPRASDGTYLGLWGHSLNTGQGFFCNDPAAHPCSRGVPGWHPPVRQFLSVPAVYQGTIVGQISLANKAGGFGDRDLAAVGSLADLFALAVHRRRVECEAEELEARMRQAQKFESLGVLAGGIAHDFNNLLMGVLGYADLALLQMPPDAPGREYLRHIEAAAERAAVLTNQMLACSGKGQFVVEAVNLNRLLRETDRLLHTVISKKALLCLDLAASLPAVLADANQLRQVVLNLVANASEALGEEEGTILVQTGFLQADRAYLAESFLAEGLPAGRYVSLDVSDTGCGMDEEMRQRIFDPFFTTKFTGRGLGLAAVLGIVRGHRGAIRVHSGPGRGAAFRVLLPAAGPELEASPCDAPAEGAPSSGELVLVADDEPTVREVARTMLEAHGYRVLTAADGGEAVELYREHRAEIAVVLLAMTMPRVGGEEAFGALRQLRPDVRVVLTSGYDEKDATTRFAGKGLAGFLQKPYRSAALAQTIRRVLRGEERD